jgi:hypothetical protein
MSDVGSIQILMALMTLISLIKLIHLIRSSPTDRCEDPFLRNLLPFIPIAWMRILRPESLLSISLFISDDRLIWNDESR